MYTDRLGRTVKKVLKEWMVFQETLAPEVIVGQWVNQVPMRFFARAQ